MAKFQSPLLGYNNNVRHRGRLFHIQTEDSGINHPHIITHVFMDGGRILKSQKRSYAEHVGSDGLSETVKQMMKEQHKAMFIALRDGQFDALVEGADLGAPRSPAKAPPPPDPALTAGAEAKVAPPAAKPPLAEDAAPPTVAEESAKVPPTDPDGPSTTREVEPPRRPSVRDLTLDFDALERESDDSGAASSLFDAPALPPPPPNLFSSGRNVEAGTGTYRALERPAEEIRREARSPSRAPSALRPSRPPPAPSRPPSQRPATEGRYAPARPAAIFGTSAKPASTTIFGAELFGDKSLDEVILSYLAEDLDPPHGK